MNKIDTQTDESYVLAPGGIRVPKAALAKAIEDTNVNNEANRVPFPGPSREAFSLSPNIKVGKYSVRPFYDGDIDVLCHFRHPLGELAIAGFGQGEIKPEAVDDWDKDPKIVRGRLAWNLCYLMTHPATEICDLIDGKDWPADFEKKAKKEFFGATFGDLAALQTAIIQQFGLYFAPVVGFGPEGDDQKKTS